MILIKLKKKKAKKSLLNYLMLKKCNFVFLRKSSLRKPLKRKMKTKITKIKIIVIVKEILGIVLWKVGLLLRDYNFK